MSDDDVFPDRDMSHRDKIEFMLEREGWAMDAVPTREGIESAFPSYAYTVGFEERFGFPEICVVGLSPVACRGLFDLVANALDGGTDLPISAPFIGLLDGGQPCAFLRVDVATCGTMFPSLVEHHVIAGDDPEALRARPARLARSGRRAPVGARLRSAPAHRAGPPRRPTRLNVPPAR